MSRKSLAITLGIIVLAVVVIVLVMQNSASTAPDTATDQSPATSQTQTQNQPQTSAPSETTNPAAGGSTTVTTTTTTTPPAASGYTMADVAKHATRSSCWTAVNGNVYDVTAWISQHPGGANAILSMCGKDGSAAFNDQHGGQRRPASELASFKIGALI